MAKRGRPRKPPAERPDSRPRIYRGLPPAPVECECGCSVFTPRHEGQRFRTPACKQAMYRFRKRRRAMFLKAHRPPPLDRDALVVAHAQAVDRHLDAIERATR